MELKGDAGKMRHTSHFIYIMMLLLIFGVFSAAADPPSGDLDTLLKGIEARYAGKGFRAAFFQESLLKAMQISDTAEGRLTVKRPDKMRWEYILPDPQTIISDGVSMWIYRPVDNQVMVGKAPAFFGGGKGAGFLSDVRQIRKSFRVEQQIAQNPKYFRLQLIPLRPTPDIAKIILSVGKSTYQVDQVTTYNAYGDETRIVFSNYQFGIDPKDTLFTFVIPEGVDVVTIDQP